MINSLNNKKYDKSDPDSIVIEKKEKVKPIEIPKERIFLSKRIKNINFYRKGGKNNG